MINTFKYLLAFFDFDFESSAGAAQGARTESIILVWTPVQILRTKLNT